MDRALGTGAIAEALRRAGSEVEIHDRHFPQDAKDTEWLPEVGRRGWVVLTKDARSRGAVRPAGGIRAGTARLRMIGASPPCSRSPERDVSVREMQRGPKDCEEETMSNVRMSALRTRGRSGLSGLRGRPPSADAEGNRPGVGSPRYVDKRRLWTRRCRAAGRRASVGAAYLTHKGEAAHPSSD